MDNVQPDPHVALTCRLPGFLRTQFVRLLLITTLGLPAFAASSSPSGALQLDVFPGFDGVVAEGCWAPLVCEIKNERASFLGAIKVTSGMASGSSTIPIELPTGTLKRIVIPVSCPMGGYVSWTVRLLDGKGNLVEERRDVRARQIATRGVPVLGSLSRASSPTPQIQATLIKNNNQMQPAVARILPPIFPDNPFTLDTCSSLYLNSERAADLNSAQIDALLQWLRHGGNLIVGMEQPQDLDSAAWLRELVPVDFSGTQTLPAGHALHEWISGSWGDEQVTVDPAQPKGRAGKSSGRVLPKLAVRVAPIPPFTELAVDQNFEGASIRVTLGSIRDGAIEAASGDTPLIVARDYGFGRVRVLLFSPEREPVRSWQHAPILWARLAEVPPQWYRSSDFNRSSGWSSDNIFGALLETRQAKKIPAGVLLVMLLGYLAVIGPGDYFLVRRLRRPGLTWITFPLYVVGFSALIYLVGFRLRAGQLEWNELNVIDAWAKAGKAELIRGRTYGSLYSPRNATYGFGSAASRSVFRGEQGWNREREHAIQVVQRGNGFEASAALPVWTSQLFTSDWVASGQAPFEVSANGTSQQFKVSCKNVSGAKLALSCVVSNVLVNLGDVQPGAAQTFEVAVATGRDLVQLQSENMSHIQQAIQMRQMAFGRFDNARRLDDWPLIAQLASFNVPESVQGYNYIVPDRGFNLAPVLKRPGQAVLFVSASIPKASSALIKFRPDVQKTSTLWRVGIEIKPLP